MCYSAEVSIQTFLFVSVVCGFLWYRNKGSDRPISLILLVVVLMQLVEYGLWENLDCGTINKTLSSFIPILLFLQPLLINFIVWWFNAGWAPGYFMLFLVSCIFLPYKLYLAWLDYGNCVKVSDDGHLEWVGVPDQSLLGFLERCIYYFMLSYPIATLNNSLFASVFIGLSALSLNVFGMRNQKTWPTIWCHYVNFLSIFALFMK
jgi:hypothetical protein